MDFDLSDHERMLKDSVERLMADRYSFEQRKSHAAEPEGWSRALWKTYAELGLLGIPFAEDYGGFGGSAVDTMIVMEAFGRSLVLEPYLATVVLAGGILQSAGTPRQLDAILPQVIAGELLLAFAHDELHARYDLSHVATTARREGAGWIIGGAKARVLHGDCADKLIVSARISGDRNQEEGLALFLVDATAPGITRQGYATQDGLRAADIRFADVRVTADAVIGEPGGAYPLIENAVERAIAATAAEAVGAMSASFDLTVEYLKTRQQFGTVIGKFQALQHRVADLLVELEQARSMALYATMMLSETDPGERRRAIAAAKVQVGQSGRFLAQHSLQLHGGIGMTAEYALGHYFKRLTLLTMQFGDPDHHLTLLAACDDKRSLQNV